MENSIAAVVAALGLAASNASAGRLEAAKAGSSTVLSAAELSAGIMAVPDIGTAVPVRSEAPPPPLVQDDSDGDGLRVAEIVFGRCGDGEQFYVNGRIFSIRIVGAYGPSGSLEDRIAVYDVSDALSEPTAAVGRTFPVADADLSFRLRNGGHLWRLRVRDDGVALFGPRFEEGDQHQAAYTTVSGLRRLRTLRGEERAKAWPETVHVEGGVRATTAPQYTDRLCTQFIGEDGRLLGLDCSVEPWWNGAAPGGTGARR